MANSKKRKLKQSYKSNEASGSCLLVYLQDFSLQMPVKLAKVSENINLFLERNHLIFFPDVMRWLIPIDWTTHITCLEKKKFDWNLPDTALASASLSVNNTEMTITGLSIQTKLIIATKKRLGSGSHDTVCGNNRGTVWGSFTVCASVARPRSERSRIVCGNWTH